MSLFHAVAWLDHHDAKIHQFDDSHVESEQIKARSQHTRRHGSAVRAEHEFHAEVCAALDGIAEVLVCGNSTSLTDFRHYVAKHRPSLQDRIVGYEAVDKPSEGQLLALARRYFRKYDRMAGTPTPA